MTKPNWHALPVHQRGIIQRCFCLGVDFIWRGASELLVAQPGAERLIEALAEDGIIVLGLEGFDINGDEVHPRLDLIYDHERAPSTWTPGRVARQWPPDVWIEIVIRDSA